MSETVTYKIVNPSDPYTIVARDRGVAAVCSLLLGHGWYPFTVLSGPADAEGVPLLALDDNVYAALEWFRETFGESIEPFIASRRLEIADALDSVLIGSLQDRRTYEAGLELITEDENRISWRTRWLDERRSSLNNIGGRAYAIAESLRSSALDVTL